MTRQRLEEKIAAIEKRLDIVIQRKDYKEASPIQDELENLTILRKEYPTIDELKADVCRAEEAVAGAAKRRDFANAASLQLEMDNAKKRLNEALNNESNVDPEKSGGVEALNISIDGIDSRADLESELTALHDQVEEAISKKDFQLASELQSKIDDKEKLRIFFPSVEELEDELRGAKKALEDAISCKDFGNASKLNDEISRLEQSVTDEREKVLQSQTNTSDNDYTPITGLDGTEMVFESRHSLEKEIRSNVLLQASEVSLKHFKKAQEIQALIDRMEMLRSNFPTVAELRDTISTKKSAMDTAISDKRFVDAEIIDKEISILELKLNAELEIDEPNEVSFNSISSNVAVRKAKYKSPTVTLAAPLKPSAISTASFVKTKKSNVKVVNDNRSVGSKSRSTDGRSDRKVSSLRPKKPLISSVGDSVLSVTQMLASKRGSASLIVNDKGGLAGIITDTDITRRLVAKHLDAASTSVSKVMTPNPTCVSMLDSAMDAMTTMVENHFRHLPVVDDKGGVVGLLDIAKCLNDAISKLEKKSKSTSGSVAQSEAQEALSQAMQSQGAQGAQAAALQALLAPLMNQAFGNQASPTLRSLLAGKPSTVVQLGTSVYEAGTKMAESRKAALVVEDGNLVGIFGFKDMMTRVVAKELPMDDTEISAVMTPNPESVSPDMTILEALQTMHDNKFLTLPVCEENGTVVGLVNVMDVIYGCGGVEGWRSIFSTSLDLDDLSETASHASGRSNAVEDFTSGPSKSSAKAIELNKTVMNLRPKKPQISSVDESILAVTKKLAINRSDSAILVDSNGQLTGIITDTDITRRVVSKGLDTTKTCISVVMTPDPKFVNHNDSAMDAMMLMIEHRFRHLPVVNGKDVVGTLDIARCLNDAISKLERSVSTKSNAAEQLMKKAIESTGVADAASLEALLYPLLNKALGADSAVPSLRSITRDTYCAIVRPETSVLDVASAMTESRKAALVVDEGQLVGIFGFKDMMTRVVAAELDQASTAVSTVMTPDPEFAEPEMNAIEALKMMHDNKFLTLPIVAEDGSVVGVVDVMDVIHACGGPDHWRSIFEVALRMDDASINESVINSVATPPVKNKVPMIKVSKNAPMVSSSPPPLGNIPSTLEFQKGSNEEFDETTFNDTYRMETASFLSDGNVVVFKIVDPDGHTHRLHSEIKIVCLRKAFVDKLAGRLKATNISFKFFDEEGDAILISTDEDLAEAVTLARNASNGSKVVVKLTAEVKKGDSNGSESILLVGIGIAVVAIAVGASMLLSSKPTTTPSRY